MLWKVQETVYLTKGMVVSLVGILLDACNPFSTIPVMEDIYNPGKLSKLINLEVESISENVGNEVVAGAGGTGTRRSALVVKLKNNQVLYLFVKTPTASIFERAFLTAFNVYQNEINFYSNVSNKLMDDADGWQISPKTYHVSQGFTDFLMIIEDVRFRPHGGCVFKTTLETPFDVDCDKIVLKELSRLHARYWRQPPDGVWKYSKETGLSLGSTPPMLRILAESAFSNVKQRYCSRLRFFDDVDEAYKLMHSQFARLRKYWSQGPITLCHGDSHMGNVFVSRGLGRGGLVDYQCLAEEHCMRDISYHLVNSCSSEDLAPIENHLMKYYLSELRASLELLNPQYAREVPEFPVAYFMHRTYALWNLTAWMICCGMAGIVMDSFVVDSLQRAMDHCHRLNSLGALQDVLVATN